MAKSKSLVTKASICAFLSIALSFAYIRVCKAQMQCDQSDPAASTYQQNQFQGADQGYGNAPSMAQQGMPYASVYVSLRISDRSDTFESGLQGGPFKH